LIVARAGVDTGLEERAGNLLEREKTVPVRPIIDECSFQAGLDAGNDRFINVAFFLFFAGRFNVQVNELLTIDNGDTEFFGLCRVKEHAFHDLGSHALARGRGLVTGSNKLVVGGMLEGLSGKATNRGISPTRLLVGP
jgi:hypothetical protein